MRSRLACVAAVLALSACKTLPPAVAEQLSRTEDGGTIRIGPGSALPNAANQVLDVIGVHCVGGFEVMAITPRGLTQATYDVARTDGVAVTYLCRKPASRDLNQMLREFASADHLDELCTSQKDCGALTCGWSRKWPGNTACMFSDGSPPLRGAGAACKADAECQPHLRCKGLQDFSTCE